jgi:hypothetical protein
MNNKIIQFKNKINNFNIFINYLLKILINKNKNYNYY